jgi:hypothetical protein
MLRQDKKYKDEKGKERSWVMDSNGNYKKILIDRVTRILPYRYINSNPCQICNYHNAYYRTEVTEYDENGKRICSITLEHCLECSELSREDMLRKCRR